MAEIPLIINGLRKPLHFCEIHDFRRKFFKYRILRVKNRPFPFPLVDKKRREERGERKGEIVVRANG
jgi:hypothetical protein